jgi:hypothetical protein
VAVVDPPELESLRGSRVLASLDRVLWQRLELADATPTGAVVAGIRRRRPARVRVDVATALALAEAGLPTVTRRTGSTS